MPKAPQEATARDATLGWFGHCPGWAWASWVVNPASPTTFKGLHAVLHAVLLFARKKLRIFYGSLKQKKRFT